MSLGRWGGRMAVAVAGVVLLFSGGTIALTKPQPVQPRQIESFFEYNLVQYGANYYAVKKGQAVDIASLGEAPGAGVLFGRTQAQVKRQLITRYFPESRLPDSALEPALLTRLGGFGVYLFRDRYYAVPEGMPVVWRKRDPIHSPGVLTSSSIGDLQAVLLLSDRFRTSQAGRPSPPAGTEPHLLETVGHYNLVAFGGGCYAVPHGTSIDWRTQAPWRVSGVLGMDDAQDLRYLLRYIQDPVHTERREDLLTAPNAPALVATLDHYNVVKYRGRYVVVPHGTPVDWGTVLGRLPEGVWVAADLEQAREWIVDQVVRRQQAHPEHLQPQLIGSEGATNLVRYGALYLSIPHGVPVQWGTTSLPEIPGVIIALSEASLRSRLRNN